MPMDLLRKHMWLWVVFGMVFMSVVISIIFLFICKCVSRRGKHRIARLKKEHSFRTESNKYQDRNTEAGIPPLPPRTQFLTAETQSYENLAEEQVGQSIRGHGDNVGNCRQNVSDHEESTHDYEESNHDYEESNHDYEEDIHDYEESTDPPDYVKMEEEVIFPPPPPYESMNGCVLEAQSYENLAEENDYEECTDDQYVKVDGDAQAGDNTSTEDYDDIGGEDRDEEDYDDVG
ncbi:uncharacterized protein scimp [Archocentrus centrarchus]|uniref:uncharacterized protein scimp n=1 Tax=Archocentrus centrarchus TaxID=63155 RepID=UPI0011E9B4E1|nr:uncharacterized protein LOC115792672 [Archocentrus centrarchus]